MTLRGFIFVLATCAVCAGGANASAQSIERVLMPGSVNAAHAETEDDCHACHKLMDRGAQSGLCLDCHEEVAGDIRAHTGYHGRVATDSCVDCHTEHNGREAGITRLEPDHFGHELTDFILYGRHAEIECTACHVAGKRFRDAPRDCVDCHAEDDVHDGAFDRDCATCHIERSWAVVRFDHGRKTGYELAGSHERVACSACHTAHEYKSTPKACVACHAEDDHHDGRFGEACESCHAEQSWRANTFNHSRETKFPLDGRHRHLSCGACHEGSLAAELDTACVSCHADDDVHEHNLGTQCDTCHRANRWTGIEMDHARTTGFALTGAHRSPPCGACHEDRRFRTRTKNSCVACHADDDRDHGHEGRFGTRCEACHVNTRWQRIRFDHDTETKFALRGAHRGIACVECHSGRLYDEPLKQACVSCHAGDDDHEGNLGTDCGACHVAASWTETRFDHARTRFALEGKHRDLRCQACHADERFWETGLECAACHSDDDTHETRLGPRCDNCHDPRGWNTLRFDHDRDTDFKLQGAHARVACLACHIAPVQGRIVLDDMCFSCHRGDDVHFATLGRNCGACHGTQDWRTVDDTAREWARAGGPPAGSGP